MCGPTKLLYIAICEKSYLDVYPVFKQLNYRNISYQADLFLVIMSCMATWDATCSIFHIHWILPTKRPSEEKLWRRLDRCSVKFQNRPIRFLHWPFAPCVPSVAPLLSQLNPADWFSHVLTGWKLFKWDVFRAALWVISLTWLILSIIQPSCKVILLLLTFNHFCLFSLSTVLLISAVCILFSGTIYNIKSGCKEDRHPRICVAGASKPLTLSVNIRCSFCWFFFSKKVKGSVPVHIFLLIYDVLILVANTVYK